MYYCHSDLYEEFTRFTRRRRSRRRRPRRRARGCRRLPLPLVEAASCHSRTGSLGRHPVSLDKNLRGSIKDGNVRCLTIAVCKNNAL